MAHSLIVLLVSEAEPYVARLREQFDPAARRGIGAHITLRHATLPPTGIDESMMGAVSAVTTGTAPFEFKLTRVARFLGTLYLAVEPTAPFADLNRRLEERLSDSCANARSDKQLVPHISVVRRGSGVDLASEEVRAVERGLAGELVRYGPIRCTCREIVLLEDATGLWRPLQSFALSGGRDSPSRAPS